MKHLYRQYRQVKISRRGSQKPEVQGYEEIWRELNSVDETAKEENLTK